MRTAWIGIGLVLALCIVVTVLADDSYISTASIFELGVSARTLGLGGASIALADDETAVFYNPAGLADLSNSKLSSLYTRPFGAYSYGVLGAAEQGWGGYLLILDSDPLEERDLYGNITGSFRYTSTGLLVGCGQQISSELSVGVQVKGYRLALPEVGHGFAVSPAVLTQNGSLTIGVVWRNLINTGTNYVDGHNGPWIKDLAVGLAWRGDKQLFCIDFTEQLITRGDTSCVRMGYEYTGFDPILLRVGTNRDGSSVGASVRWHELQVDIACLIHSALPSSYVVSLSYQGTDSLTTGLFRVIQQLSEMFR